MTDRCRICGEDNPVVLEEHHKVPRRFGGGDSAENLVTLCANCHTAVEAIYDDGFFERAQYTAPNDTEAVGLKNFKDQLVTFLEECDDVVASGVVAKQNLYQRYTDWADENGHAEVPAHNIFGRALNGIERYDITSTQRRIQGQITGVYAGVSLQRSVSETRA